MPEVGRARSTSFSKIARTLPSVQCHCWEVVSRNARSGLLTYHVARRACIPVFHPEYGRYMLESTPGAPYGATLEDLLLVEGNMRFRSVLSQSPVC